MTAIADRIRQAMQPFNPGDILIEIMDDPAFESLKVVHIRVFTFPGVHYKYAIDKKQMFLLDIDEMLDTIGKMAGEYFRNIYIEPSDNCLLGEN